MIVKGGELEGDDSPLTFRDVASARRFLRRFLRERSCIARLRDVLSSERVVTDLTRLDDRRIVDEFAKHLVSRRFRVVALDRPPLFAVPTGPEEATARPEEETSEEQAEEGAEGKPSRRPGVFPRDQTPGHWVRLLVVDDETDEPIPGVRLKVKLPSGEVGEPRTDRQGAIHIDDLSPGTLDILGILDDDALEVVVIE